MRKLGPIQDLLKMLPGVPGGKDAHEGARRAQVDDGELRRAEAIILSMTPEERRNPAIISGSRRLRIANGLGFDHQPTSTRCSRTSRARGR